MNDAVQGFEYSLQTAINSSGSYSSSKPTIRFCNSTSGAFVSFTSTATFVSLLLCLIVKVYLPALVTLPSSTLKWSSTINLYLSLLIIVLLTYSDTSSLYVSPTSYTTNVLGSNK